MQRMASLLGGIGGLRIPLLSRKTEFAPQLELKELDSEYVLNADLPGVREQDVDVRISDDNVLTVGGERREEETKRVRGYEYSERSYGSFSRSIELPPGVDASKIQAKCDRDPRGVLRATVRTVQGAGACPARAMTISRPLCARASRGTRRTSSARRSITRSRRTAATRCGPSGSRGAP
jgi:HSP20 family molecular chaperone IbpA